MKQNSISIKEVEEALKPVFNYVANDGGDIEVVEIDNNNIVKLRLLHACAKCNLPKLIFKEGVLRILQKKIPAIKDVELID
ncbi:MAG: NifU family protein [Bacteroidales bacterium]|nr:NifU family protein [Bacteroidales bacterium]MCF8327026.1 NifU family protein [Bacteroidales bacterium]